LVVRGVISVLDEPAFGRVAGLWARVEREFGIAVGFPGALPHISFHIASAYDMDTASSVLASIAWAQREFVVETSGIGVFTGPERTIYIPVGRSAELASLHTLICERLRRAGMETIGYYLQERWLPHITIAQQNVLPAVMPALLGWLSEQDFSWRLPITNLAIAEPTDDGATVFGQWRFRGRSGGV
jgi:2'-5' RNA ligase